MRFGLFSMGEHPRRLPRDAYDEDLQEIVAADSLGWDEVWIGEHHLNGKQEVLPSPEMLIAKAAARTQCIRMGSGVRLLALHYPLDVAGEAAVADHLTDGRYNFGYGTGSPLEYPFYGVPFADAQARIEESLDLIVQAWTHDGPFSWEGRYWQVRDVYLWPQPLQQPCIPMARACGSPSSWFATGHRGHWVLGSQYQTAQRIAEGWAEFERGARDAGRTPDRASLRVCRFCWVDESDRAARDAVRTWMDASLDYLRTQPPVRANLERLKPPGADVEAVTFDYLCDIGQFVVGSPETVIQRLRQVYADVGGFGTLTLVAGRDPAPISQRLAMLERFARDVAPALADLGAAEPLRA